jgi:hypothetical protein
MEYHVVLLRYYVLALATLIPSQVSQKTALSNPQAVSRRAFISVGTVRELRDGSVIVLDRGDGSLWMLSQDLQLATPIAGRGNGPGEYAAPQRLIALGGDSSILYDWGNSRFLIILPDGRPGEFLDVRANLGCASRNRGDLSLFMAVDGHGRFYSEGQPIAITAEGIARAADSAAIERTSPNCGRDTVAYVANRWGRDKTRISGGFAVGPSGVIPFRTRTQWVVFWDGAVAVVRPDPYRVDFVDPNGNRRSGEPIPYQRIPITATLKQQWREERTLPAPALTIDRSAKNRSEPSVSMKSRPAREPTNWPTHLPPFLEDAVNASADGYVWIKRALGSDQPPTYDVVDGLGRVIQQVELRARSRIVGFGVSSVYVMRRDKDDLEYLERFPRR